MGVGDNIQGIGEMAVDPYPERQSAACCCTVRDHGHDDGCATVESLRLFVQVATGSVQAGHDSLIHQQAEAERTGQIPDLNQAGQRFGLRDQGSEFGCRRTATSARWACFVSWPEALLSGVGEGSPAWRLGCSSKGAAGAKGSDRRPRRSPEHVFSIHGSTVKGRVRAYLKEA